MHSRMTSERYGGKGERMTELDKLIEAEADKCCFDWFDNTLHPA